MARFLIYDPQLVFEPFLIKNDLKPLFDIQIETCKDLPSFQKGLETDYFATALFEKGHFSEALGLLKLIKKHPIIFFVSEHRTASSFKKLKTEFGVDFVIQTPLLKDEILALLHEIFHPTRALGESIPPELIEKYHRSIFDKILRMEELCKTSETSLDALKELRTEVHKIAGSAASYGYPAASASCKAHELVLMEALKKESISEELAKKNSAFLRKLRLNFQHIDPRSTIKQIKATQVAEKISKESSSKYSGLVLISTDLPLIHTFQKLAEKFRINLSVESNPRKIEQELNGQKYDTQAILVEEYYPFTAVTGLQLIEELRPHVPKEAKFGIISDTEDVQKRIHWIETGIAWVLKKPITENNILQVFQQMESKQTFPDTRALIVDDDEDVGLIEKQLLVEMGMQVVFLSDERNLLQTLEEFTPHILLLDINLPHFQGQKLLEMLRADIRFQRMIIVLITAFKEAVHEDEVYQQNCDSIIYKPINPVYLKSRIANLLHRRMAVGLRTVIDPTTALYEKNFYLKRVLGRFPHLRDQKGAFLLLEFDLWDQISNTLSAIEKKQVIIIVANAIKKNFTGKAIYGYMGGSQFSIFFEGNSGGEIEFWMENFLSEMHKSIWLSGREDLHFTLSIGIALFGAGVGEIDPVLHQAEAALKQAQDNGGKQIITFRLGEATAASTETRRVILVDDDVELTDVISYMFKNQGIHVDVFHTGADAIDFFSKLEKIDRNILFILDRMLPDRDGLTLLRMIHEKFPGSVKAIFLTSLSTEKDVLEGLKMGAVDYVTKPFSVSVLLQKALALLNR